MRSARVWGVVFAMFAVFPADAREFRSSDIYPFGYPTVQAVVQMDKLIRERSAGRHGITVLGFDDRDSENFTVAQVRSGALDMARVSLGALNGLVPATAVPALPYLFRSTAHARRVFDGPVGEEILASLETQGLVGLCLYDAGPRQSRTTNEQAPPGLFHRAHGEAANDVLLHHEAQHQLRQGSNDRRGSHLAPQNLLVWISRGTSMKNLRSIQMVKGSVMIGEDQPGMRLVQPARW